MVFDLYLLFRFRFCSSWVSNRMVGVYVFMVV